MLSEVKDKYKDNIVSCIENFRSFNLEIQLKHLPITEDFSMFGELINKTKDDDIVRVDFIFSQDEIITFKREYEDIKIEGTPYLINETEGYNKFSSLEKNISEISFEDDVSIRFNIDKVNLSNEIFIYDESSFIKNLKTIDLKGTLDTFNELFNNRDTLKFTSYSNIKFNTSSIFYNMDVENSSNINRDKVINSRIDISNVIGVDFQLIPDDFNIIDYNDNNTENNRFWISFLNKLRELLSIIYISDITKVSDNEIQAIINGYKEVSIKIPKNEMKENERLYNIYYWLYNDGNLVDKAVIARNVLSLHCRYINIQDVNNEVINSIKTNYEYYLRKNTEDFLGEKKDLKLMVIEEAKKLSDDFSAFKNKVTKNLVAYFAFIATVVITNSIENGEFKNIFTREVVILLNVIIFGSIIYSWISFKEGIDDKKKSELYTKDLIATYGLYLGEENVKEIIENSKSYTDIRDSYKDNICKIMKIWSGINIILLIIINHSLLFTFFNKILTFVIKTKVKQ